ncbi:unnamed protein product [Lasius platythorax]|uniref:Uncharacterized protein n=1 Tax=Lasius platythorax TaxID=488582 RepID=A0AAV2NDD2_9HYME
MKNTRRGRYQQQPLAHLLGQRIDLRKFTAHSHPHPETLFFVVSSPATSMYHCLARPAPRQEYAAQNALSHYCLGYIPFMKQFEASGR